jgi:hypothetical protein
MIGGPTEPENLNCPLTSQSQKNGANSSRLFSNLGYRSRTAPQLDWEQNVRVRHPPPNCYRRTETNSRPGPTEVFGLKRLGEGLVAMDAVEQFQGRICTDDGEIVQNLDRRNLRVEVFEARTEGHTLRSLSVGGCSLETSSPTKVSRRRNELATGTARWTDISSKHAETASVDRWSTQRDKRLWNLVKNTTLSASGGPKSRGLHRRQKRRRAEETELFRQVLRCNHVILLSEARWRDGGRKTNRVPRQLAEAQRPLRRRERDDLGGRWIMDPPGQRSPGGRGVVGRTPLR